MKKFIFLFSCLLFSISLSAQTPCDTCVLTQLPYSYGTPTEKKALGKTGKDTLTSNAEHRAIWVRLLRKFDVFKSSTQAQIDNTNSVVAMKANASSVKAVTAGDGIAVDSSNGAYSVSVPTLSGLTTAVFGKASNVALNNEIANRVSGDIANTVAIADTAAKIRTDLTNNINYVGTIIGEIKMIAGANVPQHYLLADGRMLKKTEYSALYNTISGQFGENSDSFRLPNLTDKFVRGGTNRGLSGGSDNVTLTTDNLPDHTHAISGEVKVGIADQEGSASLAPNSVLGSRSLETSSVPPTRIEIYTPGTTATFIAENKLGGVSHNLTSASVGNSKSFSVLPSYLVLSYIIRVN